MFLKFYFNFYRCCENENHFFDKAASKFSKFFTELP